MAGHCSTPGRKSKKSDNYHSEMNENVFYNYLQTKCFSEITVCGKKSVQRLDRTEYHQNTLMARNFLGKAGESPIGPNY